MTDETGRGAQRATPHTTAEVLSVWLRDLARYVRTRCHGLDESALAFRPDAGGNSVGVTLWHFSRWLDVIGQRAWVDGPVGGELWHARGWASRTGYDPTGLGYRGLGVVTGYTVEEVDRIPPIGLDVLLEYFGQAVDSLREQLAAMGDEQLHEATPGLGGENSRYAALSAVLQGSFGHLGEIDALLSMRERRLVGGSV